MCAQQTSSTHRPINNNIQANTNQQHCTGNVDNLVVAADPKELLDKLASWEPKERGLVLLPPEQRAAAIGTDVSAHE